MYFLSFSDALILIVIVLGFFVNVAGLDYWTGFALGAIIASLYGYFRASVSNDKIDAAEAQRRQLGPQ